jgi:hypothetical protein
LSSLSLQPTFPLSLWPSKMLTIAVRWRLSWASRFQMLRRAHVNLWLLFTSSVTLGR